MLFLVVQCCEFELLLTLSEPAHFPVLWIVLNTCRHWQPASLWPVEQRASTSSSVQHVLTWVVCCWSRGLYCASSGLSSLRNQTTPTVLIKLEPEGRSMINAVLLLRSQRKSAESTSVRLRAAAGVASFWLLPTAEAQSAGLSETLLLSLWPRSCRTLAPASQLSIRLTHFWVSRRCALAPPCRRLATSKASLL